jgi:hypothetical protein
MCKADHMYSAQPDQKPPRCRVHLGAYAVATVAVIVVGTFGTWAGAGATTQARFDARVQHHAKHKKHGKTQSKQTSAGPCLVGNWTVTSLTLSASGLSFTGGAGTTVDIMSNGNALGNFTPGTPLTGTEGSAKFNGTIIDNYGFPAKTTALSGSFPVTPVSNNATITVAGVTRPVSSTSEQGTYTCSSKNLSLNFTSGSGTLSYQLTSAG